MSVHRLRGIGELDPDALELEAETLERAAAGLRGMAAALRDHDLEDVSKVPRLDGVVEAAERRDEVRVRRTVFPSLTEAQRRELLDGPEHGGSFAERIAGETGEDLADVEERLRAGGAGHALRQRNADELERQRQERVAARADAELADAVDRENVAVAAALAEEAAAGAELRIVETDPPEDPAGDLYKPEPLRDPDEAAEGTTSLSRLVPADELEDVLGVDEDAAAPPRADEPPAASSSSQASEPPAASSPSDSPAPVNPLVGRFNQRVEAVFAVFAGRRGEWLSVGEVARELEPADTAANTRYAVRRLEDDGRVENNGRDGGGRRYRAPLEPGDDQAPDEPEPEVEGAERFIGVQAGGCERPVDEVDPSKQDVRRRLTILEAPARPAALRGDVPSSDEGAATPPRPAVPKSGRLLRQERAEERRKQRDRIAQGAGQSLAGLAAGSKRPPDPRDATLEGRVLECLAWADATLKALASRLGAITDDSKRDLAIAVARLCDEGHVTHKAPPGGGPHIYSAGDGARALSPAG